MGRRDRSPMQKDSKIIIYVASPFPKRQDITLLLQCKTDTVTCFQLVHMERNFDYYYL